MRGDWVEFNMTRSRLYDVYFKIGDRWIYQLRTFFPFSASKQLTRGYVAKNLPVRQRAYSGRDAIKLIKDAHKEGFSYGYWRFMESWLLEGMQS